MMPGNDPPALPSVTATQARTANPNHEGTEMESKPMKDSELGRYVCVARGAGQERGCLHSPRTTINSDGVWVRSPDPDPLNPGSHLYSSAHRDCFEAWQARETAR